MTSLTLGLILDRSGSMSTAWDDTVGAVQEMLREQAAEGETLIVPVVFDNRIDRLDTVVAPSNPIADIRPRGSTALHDAVANGIAYVEQYAPENDKTAVVIVTDGYENASREHDLKSVSELISKKRDDGWEFIFIGANQDAWATGNALGTQTSLNWTQDAAGTQQVYGETSRALTSYRES